MKAGQTALSGELDGPVEVVSKANSEMNDQASAKQRGECPGEEAAEPPGFRTCGGMARDAQKAGGKQQGSASKCGQQKRQADVLLEEERNCQGRAGGDGMKKRPIPPQPGRRVLRQTLQERDRYQDGKRTVAVI